MSGLFCRCRASTYFTVYSDIFPNAHPTQPLRFFSFLSDLVPVREETWNAKNAALGSLDEIPNTTSRIMIEVEGGYDSSCGFDLAPRNANGKSLDTFDIVESDGGIYRKASQSVGPWMMERDAVSNKGTASMKLPSCAGASTGSSCQFGSLRFQGSGSVGGFYQVNKGTKKNQFVVSLSLNDALASAEIDYSDFRFWAYSDSVGGYRAGAACGDDPKNVQMVMCKYTAWFRSTQPQ